MPDVYSLFLKRFEDFTEVQKLALPAIKEGRNCIITAPTGSGKTEAALLPVLDMLSRHNGEKGIFAIYITPLRALNRDLVKRLEWLCGELDIPMSARHGDTTQRQRALQAASPPHLIITTPETLQNLFLSPRLREAMKSVKTVIVDELHELYYNKRGAQLAVALERLAELSPDFQRIGISATIGDMDSVSYFLFGKRDHEIIRARARKRFEISIEMPILPKRRHDAFEQAFALDESALARIERVSDIVNSSGATLVFANTRQVVESIGSKLIYLSRLESVEAVGIHHSSLDKEERIEIENSFKEGRLKAIIATSSLELGIDIGRIDHVIQYGSPRQAGRLVQRVGRGGHREGEISRGHIIVSGILDALEAASTVLAVEENELERHSVEIGALDVLLNQVVAVTLEYRSIAIDKLYALVKRSSPYMGLDKETFDNVLAFANEMRLIKLNEDKAVTSVRTRKYFFGSISVIPDSPRIYVKDAVRNKVISTLDENFVSSYLDNGVAFITKGTPWKVLSIEEDTVFVEPAAEFESAIPDWDGEDIPVSYGVARRAIQLLHEKEKLDRLLDKDALAVVSKFIEEQGRYFLPSEKKIVVEELDDYIIINVALGKQANEFLSRMIAGMLQTGNRDRFFVRSTPYAVIIDCSYLSKLPSVNKVLNAIALSKAATDLGFVENSELFRYKFVQVAKLFGIVEKKSALSKNMVNRLVDFYRNSVVYQETLRDLQKNYLDSVTLKSFLSKLSNKEVTLETRIGESPMSREILRSVLHYREFLSRVSAGEEEIKAFEEKMKAKEPMLICTYCGFEFSHKIDIGSEKRLECRRCKSPMLATSSDDYRNAVNKKLQGKRLDREEREAYDNAIKETGLISSYGDRAIIALLTYGVGLVTAGRVLKMIRKDPKYFIKDLIDAQKLFIKNSKFWARTS